MELAIRHCVLFFCSSRMFRYVAAGEDGGLRSRSRTLHWLPCGDRDGDSHLTPNSDLPPQLPSPHPHGSQVPTSKTTAAMPTHPPHLQNIHPPRICPQCNPPGDPAHSPGGVYFASLGEDGRDGNLPDLQTQQLAESDLNGSTRNMGSSRWGCSDVGSAARGRHRSQLLPSPPETDAVVPECEPAACVKGRRLTFPCRRGERRP